MPRFTKSRTWQLLNKVLAEHYRLVKEALSLRQKIITARQSIHFLQGCLKNRIIPNFIKLKRLHDLCGIPKKNHRVQEIQLLLLRTCLRTKQDQVFAKIKKCVYKEKCCARYLEERLWKEIVSGSVSICNLIRSNAKASLQKKFDNLLSKPHGHSDRQQSTLLSTDNENIDNTTGRTTTTTRVTVLGSIPISDNTRSLLSLRPSFSPSRSTSTGVMRRIVCNLHDFQDRLRYRAKLETVGTTQQAQAFPTIPFPPTFFKQQRSNFKVDVPFRLFADEVLKVLNRFRYMRTPSNLTYEMRGGIKAIRELVDSAKIRLSISDKGGEFVVIPRKLDKAITKLHLRDDSLYRPSSVEEFMSQHRRLNREWTRIAKSARLPSSGVSRLKIELPTCAVLYLLIKTHKLCSYDDVASNDPSTFEARPIVSCVGGPTDRLAWFLNLILVQSLQHIPAHLKAAPTIIFIFELMEFSNLRHSPDNSATKMVSEVTAYARYYK
ncbi:hypothetical protein Y032_0001g72 [Ancylostoma ceylanicum]|uniref:Uncharacterized protein n=1 Tax=Ancylostoma ceylanicum TaxID=53326 RepID=A0A016W485_9BILA|nr:hypothetical protein Y032_0001g72 [Ancylostoma ceylanicum]